MQGPRVLVIEDEFLIGLELVACLQSAGLQDVEHAPTEKEALRRLHLEWWDAVLADANLNGRNLDQIARTLHERAIPFVVLTGYDPGSLPASVGHVEVLTKPFVPSAVVSAVRRSLQRDRQSKS